jgi:hypothetical protein
LGDRSVLIRRPACSGHFSVLVGIAQHLPKRLVKLHPLAGAKDRPGVIDQVDHNPSAPWHRRLKALQQQKRQLHLLAGHVLLGLPDIAKPIVRRHLGQDICGLGGRHQLIG